MTNLPALPRKATAQHYRERADKLRRMAEAEEPGKLRDDLIRLARQYEDLANSMTARSR